MKIIYIKIKNFKSISELEINDIENAPAVSPLWSSRTRSRSSQISYARDG